LGALIDLERAEAETASRHTFTETVSDNFGNNSPAVQYPGLAAGQSSSSRHGAATVADEEDEMVGYCWDAYYTQLVTEYEACRCSGERRPASEWPIPLRWVMAWIGGLSVISLGLGSLSQWLLQ
jgi:hypothetical protein